MSESNTARSCGARARVRLSPKLAGATMVLSARSWRSALATLAPLSTDTEPMGLRAALISRTPWPHSVE